MASIIAGFTLEAAQGPQTAEAMVQAISNGRVPMPIEAHTYSYSIFSSLVSAHLKLPAEMSTYYHLAYLREQLATGPSTSDNWTDTRDMVADGRTRGSVDRSLIAAVVDGPYVLQHGVHEYCEPVATITTV